MSAALGLLVAKGGARLLEKFVSSDYKLISQLLCKAGSILSDRRYKMGRKPQLVAKLGWFFQRARVLPGNMRNQPEEGISGSGKENWSCCPFG